MKHLSLARWLRGETFVSIWDGVFVLFWIGEVIAYLNWQKNEKKYH